MKIKYLLLSVLFPSFVEASTGGSVHHYELHFNSCSAQITAYACSDASCSQLYQPKAKLHVKANGSNLVNFNSIVNGRESAELNQNKLAYPFTMVVQSDGNGGNMDPDAANPLVCYVDGVKTCTVSKPVGSTDNGPFTLSIDTGYADGHAPIQFSGNCLASNATVDVDFGFDSSASGFDGPVTVSWNGGSETLNAGNQKTLTLPVSGASLSYPRADLLNFSASQILGGATTGEEATDQAAFVPVSWEVQNAVDCGGDNGFVYGDHAGSCVVLGPTGNTVEFSLAALDANGNKLPLNWLKKQDGLKEFIGASLESSNGVQDAKFDPNDNGGNLSLHQLDAEIVGRLGITFAKWTAQYIPGDDSQLSTDGHSAFIGRIVPASLQVREVIAGDIKDDVVYAAQPETIAFDSEKVSGFVIEGLDTDDKPLSSYSGEFAGGLKANSKIQLDSNLSDANLTLTYAELESEPGQHLLALNPTSLTFIKNKPFAETGLNLPLELTIAEHDQTSGVNGETTLADADDKLRFGYLVLEDTELPVNTDGYIEGKLYYFDKFKSSTPVTENHFSFADHIAGDADITATATEPSAATVPGLVVDKDGLGTDGIGVTGYGQAATFDVALEVDEWLKPHDGSGLVQPTAELEFTEDPRKHANDRVFNRREVTR